MADPRFDVGRHPRVQRRRRRRRGGARAAPGRAWHEILVVDDGSTDDTAEHAAAAGATVVRHPYNKGNGASVKSRHPRRDRRVRADPRRRRPAQARGRLPPASRASASTTSSSAPAIAERRRRRARGASATPSSTGWPAIWPGRPIPDLTSGFRAMRREHVREFLGLLPNGFSSPTTITLSFIRAGHSVRFEPVQARQRSGHSKIRFARDGVKFFLILLRVITIFSPLRIFLPISGAVVRGRRRSTAAGTSSTDRHIPNGAVLLPHVRGDHLSRRPGLRADLGAARVAARADAAHGAQRAVSPRRGVAIAVGVLLRLAFGLGYWTGKPLTHDEREYLALADQLWRTGAASRQRCRANRRPVACSSFGRAPRLSALPRAADVARRRSARRPPAGRRARRRCKIAQALARRRPVADRARSPAVGRVAGRGAAAAAAWLAAVYPAAGLDAGLRAERSALLAARAGLRRRARRGDRRPRRRRGWRPAPPVLLARRACSPALAALTRPAMLLLPAARGAAAGLARHADAASALLARDRSSASRRWR